MSRAERRIERWIMRTAPRAIGYARTLLSNPDMAEDLVQDVLCRLLDHTEYDLLRDGENLLFRSVSNACISAGERRRQMASLDAEGPENSSLIEKLESSRSGDPAEAAASLELLSAVQQQLKGLPPLQRAAVELKALGRTLKEIAEVLDVTAANAGVLVHRGRQMLIKKLGTLLPEELTR